MSTTARLNRAALTPCFAFGRHVITVFRIHFSTFSHLKKRPTLDAVTSTKRKAAERRRNLVQICRATALECTALQCFALFCFCCFFFVWLAIATISKKYLANINFQRRMDAVASAPVSPSIPPHRGGGGDGGDGGEGSGLRHSEQLQQRRRNTGSDSVLLPLPVASVASPPTSILSAASLGSNKS